MSVDAFVSSDLKRAIDTCRMLATPHNKDVFTTPLLRERDWGGFTGRYIPDLRNEVWPDDIETLDALLERADRFLSLMRQRYPEQTVVAVGHGIVNKAIQAVHFGKDMKDVERMTNCEVRVLELK
jgi:probable phosphoglycerate mutase